LILHDYSIANTTFVETTFSSVQILLARETFFA